MTKSRIFKGILRTLAIVIIIGLIVPLLLPYPPITGAVQPQQLADPDSQFIQIDNVTLHYKTYGQGEPVFILLHGTLLNTYSWHDVVGPLSKLGRVIAYDRPPFGLSSRPMPGTWKGGSPYSYESQTDLLIKLMDALNIKKAILVGNSMGGGIAIYTAQRYPDRVQGLVLIAPAQTRHFFSSPVRWLLGTPQMRSMGPLVVRSQLMSFAGDLYRLSWHDPSKIQPQAWDEYLAILKMENWDRAIWELLVAAKPFETILRFESISAPTLIITGDDDRVLGTETNIQLADKIFGSQLVVIPDCGHVAQEECPVQVNAAIEKWLFSLSFIDV
jgi:pimeloyl-ACP methyl ester carboxylesterase